MFNIIQLIMAFFGSMGFAFIFNTKKDILLPTCVGGFLAWLVYLITHQWLANPYLCVFIASLFMGIYAGIMARIYKKPTTVFIAVGAIPLIPGSGLYYAIYYLLLQNTARSLYYAKYTLIFASCMSAGIIFINILFSQFTKQKD